MTLHVRDRFSLELCNVIGSGVSVDLEYLVTNNDTNAADVHFLVLVPSCWSSNVLCDLDIDDGSGTLDTMTEVPLNV
jgi:hypothetical protein